MRVVRSLDFESIGPVELFVTKYGVGVVAKSMIALAFIVAGVYVVSDSEGVRFGVSLCAVLLAGFVVSFFRDPERSHPRGENIVLSPADGKVVLIEEVFEPVYLGENALQVSIFMSPLNVHVNRFPLSGTVGYFRHIHGDHIVAFNEKSSERNERTLIGVEGNGYKILFKQIAGAVARRIVAPVTIGQRTVIGERFGMIRFGSRVDVLMPKSTEVLVKLQDRVVAGETILARYPASEVAVAVPKKSTDINKGATG